MTNPSKNILIPMAHITCKMIKLYSGLKVIASVTITISARTSHNPLFIKKAEASAVVFRRDERYAETPERNTKTGAQKCVIQRVKKKWVSCNSRIKWILG